MIEDSVPVHLNEGKTSVLAIGFVSFIALGFVMVLIQGFYAVIVGDSPIGFGLFLLFFTWMAYITFFTMYWAFVGTEEITFKQNYLLYKQKVFGLSRTWKYKLHKIDKPNVLDLSDSIASLGYAMFGLNNYSVRFKYGMRRKAIGAKATLAQANAIVEKLKR